MRAPDDESRAAMSLSESVPETVTETFGPPATETSMVPERLMASVLEAKVLLRVRCSVASRVTPTE